MGEKENMIEEFEEGKINFEKILERKLEKASEHYRNMEYPQFALTVQQIWNDCIESDRKAIEKLAKKWIEEEKLDNFRDLRHFKKYLEAKAYSYQRHLFRNERNMRYWLEIYRVLGNGLKMRYYGKRRSWEKDEGFE